MDKPPKSQQVLSKPESWLTQHGDALYRYAYFRLRDAAQAEDLVQETLLAALQARQGFAGRATERTWLIGILKNKLVDFLRKSSREQSFGDMESSEIEIDALFDTEGHWKLPPSTWENPANALEQKQFWNVMAKCLGSLPPRHAQVFSLCELDGLDSTEACKVFGIAATNVWVMLHRARLRLRQCLETHWFGRETRS